MPVPRVPPPVAACRLAEAFDDVGVAVAFRILQRDQKPARRRRIVLVINAAQVLT